MKRKSLWTIWIIILIFILGIFLIKTKPIWTNSNQSISITPVKNNQPISPPPLPTNSLNVKVSVTSAENGTITGNIQIINPESVGYSNLYPSVTLLTPETQTSTPGSNITIVSRSKVAYNQLPSVNINSNQTFSLPFKLSYSPYAEPGIYQIQVDIIDKLGTIYGLGFDYPKLSGSDSFVKVSGCTVVAGGADYGVQEAPPVDAGGLIQGKCTFENTTSRVLTLTPKIDYSVFHYLYYPNSTKLQEMSTDGITLSPGEAKTASFTLPSNLDPQVYEAEVSFVDSSGLAETPMNLFRWSITGPSARMEDPTLDHDYYAEGDIAQISTVAYPSMDLYWFNNPDYKGEGKIGTVLKNSSLEAKITDNNGQTCAIGNFSLPTLPPTVGSWGKIKMSVNILKNCLNPKVVVLLFDSGKLLAQADKSYTSSSTSPHPNSQSKLIYLMLGLILVLMIVLLVFKFRKPKVKLPPIFGILLLILVSTLSALVLNVGSVKAISLRGTAVNGPSSLNLGFYYYYEISWYASSAYWWENNGSFSGSANKGVVTLSGANNNAGYGTWGCGNGGNHISPDLDMFVSKDGGANWVGTSDSVGGWSYTDSSSSLPHTYYLVLGSGVQNSQPSWTSTDNFGTDCGSTSGSNVFVNNSTCYPQTQYGVMTVNPPSVPSLSGSPSCSGTNSLASLSWNGVSGASYYNIYKDGSYYTYTYSTSYNDGATVGVGHSYNVTAVGSGGESNYSNTVSVTGQTCIPSSPTGVSAAPVCSGTSPQVRVSWNASSGATYYNVYKSGTKINSSNITTNSYIDTNVLSNTSYSYTVTACNGIGCSSQSGASTATSSWCDSSLPSISVSTPPPPGQTCITPGNLAVNGGSATATDTGSGVSSVTFNIYDSSNPGAVVSSAPGVIDSCVSRNTSPGGGCLNGTWTNSSAFPTANMVTGHSYFTKATATDAAGNTATSNPSATYDYDSSTCVGPYLKTGSGDVHSNQNINTPGGP